MKLPPKEERVGHSMEKVILHKPYEYYFVSKCTDNG